MKPRLWRLMRILLAAVPLWLAVPTVYAQYIYTCRDANNQLITSDRPLAECSGRKQQQLNRSGTVVREIPVPLTEAQRAEQAVQKSKERAAELALEEERRKDRLLLSSYPNAEAIEATRQRRVAEAQDSIKASEGRISLLEREQQTLLKDAEANKGKTPPATLKRRLDAIAASLAHEKRLLSERNNEVVRIHQRFGQDKKRYEALTTDKPTR